MNKEEKTAEKSATDSTEAVYKHRFSLFVDTFASHLVLDKHLVRTRNQMTYSFNDK